MKLEFQRKHQRAARLFVYLLDSPRGTIGAALDAASYR